MLDLLVKTEVILYIHMQSDKAGLKIAYCHAKTQWCVLLYECDQLWGDMAATILTSHFKVLYFSDPQQVADYIRFILKYFYKAALGRCPLSRVLHE